MRRFLLAICAILLPGLALSGDANVVEAKGAMVADTGQYYVRISCTARNADTRKITPAKMLDYMRSLTGDGEWNPSKAKPRTEVFHSIIISTEGLDLSKVQAGDGAELPAQSIVVPMFYATRKGRRLTNFYDGTSTCPDQMFVMGKADVFVSSVFYHSNERTEDSLIVDIAQFLGTSMPSLKYLIVSREFNESDTQKIESLSPLATAVNKLIRLGQAKGRFSKPFRLREGTTQISSSLATMTITVTKQSSFLRSKAPFRDRYRHFLPTSGHGLDFSTDAKVTSTCVALKGSLDGSGLTSPTDQAYMMFRAARELRANKEQLIRCLGAHDLANEAAGPATHLFDADEAWRISQSDIDTFVRNHPDAVPSPEIEDKAANAEALKKRGEVVDRLTDLLWHRVRRADSFEGLDRSVRTYIKSDMSHRLTIRDETAEAMLDKIKDDGGEIAGDPFSVLKAMSELGFQRIACVTGAGDVGDSNIMDGKSFYFLAFQQPHVSRAERKENPLDPFKAVVVWPQFDKDGGIAEFIVKDQDVDAAIAANSACTTQLGSKTDA